ncbi:MAG: hypothetical protein IRY99_03470 [Isosphaeraceae bacterium]|nr:hypothetical protein [Isosphaeraceae bacterium]
MTPRERRRRIRLRILELHAEGLTPRQIARRRGIGLGVRRIQQILNEAHEQFVAMRRGSSLESQEYLDEHEN